MRNRPFLDSQGQVGASFVKPIRKDLTSRNLPKGQKITFEINNRDTITVSIPTYVVYLDKDQEPNPVPRKIQVTKKNAIRLAHWLLDNCSET